MSRSSLIPGSDTSDFADFIILFRGFHILYTMQCLKIVSVIYAVEIKFKVRKNIVFVVVLYAYINTINNNVLASRIASRTRVLERRETRQ